MSEQKKYLDFDGLSYFWQKTKEYQNNKVDQSYSPTSENAQSGIAIAEALSSIKPDSIEATVTQTSDGATIIITDKNGTTTATVVNGEKGEKGETGDSGVYVGSGEMPEDCNVQIDPDGEVIDLSEYATKEYVNTSIGNIDTALDNIIAIQNSYIGGVSE